jgi:hypothetical protein
MPRRQHRGMYVVSYACILRLVILTFVCRRGWVGRRGWVVCRRGWVCLCSAGGHCRRSALGLVVSGGGCCRHLCVTWYQIKHECCDSDWQLH